MPGLVIATVLGMIIGPRATPFYLGALALAALVLLYRERQPLIDVATRPTDASATGSRGRRVAWSR